MWAYSDDGLSWRRVKDASWLVTGEVLFDHEATDEELVGIFSEGRKKKKLKLLADVYNSYINSRYDDSSQLRFQVLLTAYRAAIDAGGLTQNKIDQYNAAITKLLAWFAWLLEVQLYYMRKRKAIKQALTPEEVIAVSWDFTTFNATDPALDIDKL